MKKIPAEEIGEYQVNLEILVRDLYIANNVLQWENNKCRASEKALQEQLCFLQRLVNYIPVDVFYKDKSRIYQCCNSTDTRPYKWETVNKYDGSHKASDKRFTAVFNISPIPMAISSIKDGRYLKVNDSFVEIIGYKREELVGRTSLELGIWDKATRDKTVQLLQEQGTLRNFEHIFLTKSGQVHTGLSCAELIELDGQKCILSVVNDITERKTLEEELRESEARYRNIFNAVGDALVISDTNGQILEVNPRACQIYGYTREEFIKLHYRDIIHPDYYPIYEHCRQDFSSTDSFCTEVVNLKKDGTPFYIEARGTWLNSSRKRVILSIIRDITERKEAEDALLRSEELLHLITDNMLDMICLTDVNHKIIYASPSFEKCIGVAPRDLLGKYILGRIHPEDKPAVEAYVQKSVNNKSPGRIVFRQRHADGRYLWFESTGNLIVDQTGQVTGAVLNSRDITARRQFEQQMARLDRLNLVGQMAASIGHEVRNPMTTVRGFLQVLGEKAECTQYKSYFELMIEELDRANTIISQFLSLAKNKPVDKKMLNLNDIVNTILPLIQADALKNDKYLLFKSRDVSNLPLDEKEIRQLLLNLVRNGLEAMSVGQTVTITTYTDNGHVVLAVQDQGTGIDKDILKDIGTPFLTNKENGTGLGLAVCYSIAQRHNASIEIKTGSGGTTFYIRFKKPAN